MAIRVVLEVLLIVIVLTMEAIRFFYGLWRVEWSSDGQRRG